MSYCWKSSKVPCSDSLALFVFLCYFGTVTTVWHHLFFYLTLEMFGQYNIFFLCDFGTVSTIWHYLFFYVTLELFQQSVIIVPKSNRKRKTKNATLSEQFQILIEKQRIAHCRNISIVPKKKK
jgi:hypothetical protein